MMILQKCTDEKAINNNIVKIEQALTIKKSVLNSPILTNEGDKLSHVPQIIRIIEFFLMITGKSMEKFQIKILAGDIYNKFRNDSLDDIILMFKMIRTNELGKIEYTDSFNQKIMLYADKYLIFKSEQREKIIELQRKKFKEKASQETMSDEAYQKFTELQNKIKAPAGRLKNTFSIKNALLSIDNYLEELPNSSMKLSDSDLAYEIKKTEFSNKQAWEILIMEKERRKTLKKKK